MNNLLSNKTIWLFSTEAWGKQKLSKHYYAIEMANQGASVFFMNPPQPANAFMPVFEKEEGVDNLQIVSYKGLIRARRFLPAFAIRFLSWLQLSLLKRFCPQPDYVLSFDCDNVLTYSPFGKAKKALLVYDLIHNRIIENRLLNAVDLLVTITSSIADKISHTKTPVLLLQHGLNSYFSGYANKKLASMPESTVRANGHGLNALFVGSLFKMTIDTRLFKEIIQGNPSITFHFFGAYQEKENNLGGSNNNRVASFIVFLQEAKNVRLYGAQPAQVMVSHLDNMDFCLHLQDGSLNKTDISNAHKLIEYLATGLPVYASPVSGESKYTDLLFFADDTVDRFNKFLGELKTLQSEPMVRQRLSYALENTYSSNTKKIFQALA